jgi:hypothetical protein
VGLPGGQLSSGGERADWWMCRPFREHDSGERLKSRPRACCLRAAPNDAGGQASWRLSISIRSCRRGSADILFFTNAAWLQSA